MRRAHGGRPSRRADRRTERTERGETLLELLVTVVIMGIGVVGAVLAITNTILVSDRVSSGSRANLAAQQEAELIKAAPYVSCAGVAAYPLVPSGDLPSGWEVEIVEVRYWEGDVGSDVSWSADQTACQTVGDQGVQQLVVEVRSDAPRQVEKQVVVAKRDRTCDSGAPSGVVQC